MIHCIIINFHKINPEWISAITAVLVASVAFFEYYFRRRPYLKMEIDIQERQGTYFFIGRVVNFGNTPARFWLKKEEVKIKIGDELYFSEKDVDGYVFPKDTQPPFMELGKINPTGVDKLINKQFKDNSADIDVIMNYESYRLKWITYKFHLKYGINFSDGTGGNPKVVVFILNQKFT